MAADLKRDDWTLLGLIEDERDALAGRVRELYPKVRAFDEIVALINAGGAKIEEVGKIVELRVGFFRGPS